MQVRACSLRLGRPEARGNGKCPSAPTSSYYREQKRFLSIAKSVLEDAADPVAGGDLRPLLDLCRASLRAEEAGRFPLAQGCRPAADLLPRSGGQLPLSVQHLSPPRRHRVHRTEGQLRFQCIYHGWTYGNDGRLVGVPGADAYAESFDKSSHGRRWLARFEEYRGFWFMCLDEDADRFPTTLRAPRDTSISWSTNRRPARWN